MQQEILLFYYNTEQLRQHLDSKNDFTHLLIYVEKNPLLTF